MLTDDSNEPELFLFQSTSKNPRLSFTRLLPTDYPLRVLLGNAEKEDVKLNILQGKGPNFYLVFINMFAIEQYLKLTGELRQSVTETNYITQLDNISMINSKLFLYYNFGRYI